MKRHEKGFQKDGFFAKDLELGLFNPFKDVKEGVLLDEKEIDAEEEVAAEGQGVTEQGDDACVQVAFVFVFFLICWNLAIQAL